jgi:hypothetical protein
MVWVPVLLMVWTAGVLALTVRLEVDEPPWPPWPEIATALAAEAELDLATPIPVAVVFWAIAGEANIASDSGSA